MNDMNLVLLCGRLATAPELRDVAGTTLLRSLITVRSALPRRRIDVVPVILWEPAPGHDLFRAAVGDTIWAACSVQRRFFSASQERQSVLEVVAHHIEVNPLVGGAACIAATPG